MTKKQLEKLKIKIEKDFGKKCKDFVISCACCQAWFGYGILEDLYFGWKY